MSKDESLVTELKNTLTKALGDAVRFDNAQRAVYASDASNYRQVPYGIVTPLNIEDFIVGANICRQFNVPILMRGAGTSQCGQAVNVAVIFDLSKHCNRILSIDEVTQTATVEPGVICSSLIERAERFGLTFAPDPSTKTRCTLGGMIANNSCGPHSVMAGKTLENVEALEILTYDGERFWVGPTSKDEYEKILAGGGRRAEIYHSLHLITTNYAEKIRQKFPQIKRRVSGYNSFLKTTSISLEHSWARKVPAQ
jgi:FAD/FMN-containing dehydrogenase